MNKQQIESITKTSDKYISPEMEQRFNEDIMKILWI